MVKAKALMDSGATHNFLPSKLAVEAECKVEKTAESAGPIQLGNGQQVECLGVAKNVAVEIGELKDEVDFHVLPSRDRGAILGMPWLHKHEPSIKWKEGVVTVEDDHGEKKTIALDERKELMPEINAISATQMKREIRKKGSEMYLAVLKLVSDDETDSDQIESKPKLSEEGASKVNDLLKEYADVFPDDLPGLPPHREVEHSIELCDDEPVFRQQYRLSPKERSALTAQLSDMMSKGLVQPSKSPYSAPILFVKKKDGSLRMVIDYRALNKKTVKDRFPLPRIDDLVDRLGKARYFSKMDLQQGFYQIRIKDADIHKTAFSTPWGSYELLVMPMGQSNSPATFQRLMTTVFPPSEFNEFLAVYLDDLLVFSETEEDHIKHLKVALERLREKQLYVKRSKCEFGMDEIEFLGQVVGNGKRKLDAAKAKAVREFKTPRNASEVRSFYGLVNFCRDFLPGLSNVSGPLTDLTKKGVDFKWTDEHEEAFQEIKRMIAEAVELAIVDENKDFLMQTDRQRKEWTLSGPMSTKKPFKRSKE
eukprot:Partr_v1_DN28545_c0_g2_i1_m73301 putative Retrotransposon protein